MKVLLGKEEANPERLENGGHKPLLFASWIRHDGLVKMLPEPGGHLKSQITETKHRPLSPLDSGVREW